MSLARFAWGPHLPPAAAAIPDVWWTQLVVGVGSFAFACFLIRWRRSRNYLMSFAHWLTGQ